MGNTKEVKLEEKQMNRIMFIVTIGLISAAILFVMVFLEGEKRDLSGIICIMTGIMIRIFEEPLGKYAKYLYVTNIPFWGAFVIVIDGEGRFGAMTDSYILWLLLAVAYYDVSVVLWCAGVCLGMNGMGLLVFQECFYQIHNKMVWVFILIVYILAVIGAVVVAKRTCQLFEKEQQVLIYEKELSYFQELQKKDEKYGRFIHDINHYFKAIGALAEEENYYRISGILEELNVKMEQNTLIIYTRYRVLNAVLSEKRSEAEQKGIILDIYVEPKLSMGRITDGDVISIMSNLLDNAIEATVKCEMEKKRINVRIYMEREGRLCIIKISNPFSQPLIKNKNGFVSTKKEKGRHGIGLKNVEAAVKNYDGYLEYSIEENKFTVITILTV